MVRCATACFYAHPRACRVCGSVSSPTHGQEGIPALLLAHVVHEARCCKYLRPCSRRAPRVSHTCLGRSHLCRIPCGLCRPNPYVNAHTRAYVNAYRDSQSHSNSDARTHTYAGTSDRYTHTDRDRYTDLYPYADCHAYGYPDSDADT